MSMRTTHQRAACVGRWFCSLRRAAAVVVVAVLVVASDLKNTDCVRVLKKTTPLQHNSGIVRFQPDETRGSYLSQPTNPAKHRQIDTAQAGKLFTANAKTARLDLEIMDESQVRTEPDTVPSASGSPTVEEAPASNFNISSTVDEQKREKSSLSQKDVVIIAVSASCGALLAACTAGILCCRLRSSSDEQDTGYGEGYFLALQDKASENSQHPVPAMRIRAGRIRNQLGLGF
mmetsp:Transcript_6306/g.13452  ORF Transcript_6306/g.13452 Transcript_6306/m.13452 type:complete len:232 (+) Transcript_6306:120-815(+)